MMTRALALLLLLACPAQALKLVVWDNELQTKLGAGESSGGRFSVQLVKEYSGPVKVLFSQSADEKSRGLFPGLQSSYDGLLKNGQLTVMTDDRTPTQRSAAPLNSVSAQSLPSGLPLNKFLQQYKLNLGGAGAPGDGGSLLLDLKLVNRPAVLIR